jgi:pimeloyl-ACP methyl ester carboxylesterase
MSWKSVACSCALVLLGIGMAFSQEAALSDVAKEALADLTGADYGQLFARFDEKMQAALPEAKLPEIWKAVTTQAGAFKSQGAIRQDKSGQYDVVTVTCQFERATLDVRLVFNAQRQLSGLFFAPGSSNQVRPQDPKPPFPYSQEEVAYESLEQGVKLAGTLTIPDSTGPFPAVLLITGSGSQNRNEEIMGHKPFLVLADYLTRRGIAVLRVDDRGVGGSSAGPPTATSLNLVQDVLGGVAYLKSRKEINPGKIGLIGHSEGGIIAPIAANQSPDVAFIVLMAGSGVKGEDLLLEQGRLLMHANGAGEELIQENAKVQKMLFNVIKSTSDKEAAEKQIREFLSTVNPAIRDTALSQMNMALSPWMCFFVTYDPRTALLKVKCPVLAINGEKDLQVPPRQNLPAIENALRAGGNKDFKVVELPGLNHLFQTCKTGTVSEYSQIEETISPTALELIGSWILQHTRQD